MTAFKLERTWGWAFVALLAIVVLWTRSARLFKSNSDKRPEAIHVFAAASLTEAFGKMARLFEASHPDVAVRFNFAGSQELALQIEEGAPADVFVSADKRWMNFVQGKSLLASNPVDFVQNSLLVVVPASNPGGILSLQDLARPGLKLVLAADAVPVGKYSREVIERLAASPGFPRGYQEAVLTNLVSNEEDVKAVLGKVVLGEADAGMVYRSDVTPAVSGRVRTLDIPAEDNVIANYPLATLKGSKHPRQAQAFVDFVQSATGRNILTEYRFIPVQPQ